jgi:hypothetical protein
MGSLKERLAKAKPSTFAAADRVFSPSKAMMVTPYFVIKSAEQLVLDKRLL